MYRITAIGLLVLTTIQWGCAQLPPDGSLERMALEAKLAGAKSCYQVYSKRHPNVPTRDIIAGCRQTYGLVSAPVQPIGARF